MPLAWAGPIGIGAGASRLMVQTTSTRRGRPGAWRRSQSESPSRFDSVVKMRAGVRGVVLSLIDNEQVDVGGRGFLKHADRPEIDLYSLSAILPLDLLQQI